MVFLPAHPLLWEPREPGLLSVTCTYTKCGVKQSQVCGLCLVTFEEARRKGEKENDPGIASSKVAQRMRDQPVNRMFSLEPVMGRYPAVTEGPPS